MCTSNTRSKFDFTIILSIILLFMLGFLLWEQTNMILKLNEVIAQVNALDLKVENNISFINQELLNLKSENNDLREQISKVQPVLEGILGPYSNRLVLFYASQTILIMSINYLYFGHF